MIRNETQYKQTVRQIHKRAARIEAERDKLREQGLSKDQIKRALDPVRSFHE